MLAVYSRFNAYLIWPKIEVVYIWRGLKASYDVF